MPDDRNFAGRELGEMLQKFANEDALVVGIARSGIPVAVGIGAVLQLPVHVLAVRKLELPDDPPVTVGALAEDGSLVLDGFHLEQSQLIELIAEATRKCKAVVARHRGDAPLPDVRGRTVILVDDVISTGATASAAIRLLGRAGAAKLIVAAPFAVAPGAERVRNQADALVALEIATPRAASRCRYASFERLNDDESISAFGRATGSTGR
jgi:putative phosphoribosyl transferase